MFGELLAKLDRARAAVAEADAACRELGIGLSPDDALRAALAGCSDAQLEAVERMAAQSAQEARGEATADARPKNPPGPRPPRPAEPSGGHGAGKEVRPLRQGVSAASPGRAPGSILLDQVPAAGVR
jgi:hypothetical protein